MTALSPEPRRVLTAWHYTWFTFCFLLLAIYGSLVPLKYTPLPWDEAVARFQETPFLQLGIDKRADWVANVLLFIPLGFLGMAALSVDRPRWRSWLWAPVWILLLAALSVAIEFTQLFFPPRTVSQNDIQAETLGAILGTAAWLLLGQKVTRWARKAWAGLGSYGQAALLLPGYLVFLVWVHVMPLDLTISPVEVWRKWKEGKIILVPFTTPYDSVHKAFLKNLTNFLYFLPVGLLFANLRHPFWHEHRNALKIVGLGLLVVCGVEFLQLFVFTRYVDTTDLCTGTLAVFVGWKLALWGQGQSTTASRLWCGAGVAACTFLILYMNWEPFDFSNDAAKIEQRWQRLNWIPFAEYYWGAEYDAFDNLLRKTTPFFIAGLCWAGALRHNARWLRQITIFLGGLALSVVVEYGQVLTPSHYPGITDVLMQPLAAWLGTVVGGRLPWAL